MQTYFPIFIHITLPILVTCFFGYLLQRSGKVEGKSLTYLSVYVLSPCLIFVSLTTSHANVNALTNIFLFTVLHTLLCFISAIISNHLLQIVQVSRSAITLTTLFGNSSNYGLPLLLLAFGNTGFTLGTGYVVGQVILINTIGIFIASRSEVSAKEALIKVFQTPLIYATIFGFLFYYCRLPIYKPLYDSLKMIGTAYPAVVLIILGTQIGKINRQSLRQKSTWAAVFLRVVIVPLLALLTNLILGIHGMLASILLVQSSMPAAINTVVLTERFGGDKDCVASAVSITTLLSFITLPLLVFWSTSM